MRRVSAYTDPDEARSDLFLSGAAYVFGGTLFAIILSITRLDRVPVVAPILALLVPLATTVLAPILLMRYRGDTFRDLGLGGGRDDSLLPGLLTALPVVAAGALMPLLVGRSPLDQMPVAQLLRTGDAVVFGALLLHWLGLGFLALYGTVKARDAFRGFPQPIEDSTIRIGRVLGIVAGVALVLIILGSLSRLEGLSVLALLAYPIGVAAAVLVALRVARGAATTKVATLLTPVVLLGIGPFALTLDVNRLSLVLYAVALYSGIGLAIGVLVERTQRGAGVLLLVLILAFVTQLNATASVAL